MSNERIYAIDGFQQPADGEPIRSVITESLDAAVIAWYVKPGQSIHPHCHPDGQDTWTILSGGGQYQYNEAGDTMPIRSSEVVVARRGDVHGVFNDGTEPLEFISVVSPGSAGYEPLSFLPS